MLTPTRCLPQRFRSLPTARSTIGRAGRRRVDPKTDVLDTTYLRHFMETRGFMLYRPLLSLAVSRPTTRAAFDRGGKGTSACHSRIPWIVVQASFSVDEAVHFGGKISVATIDRDRIPSFRHLPGGCFSAILLAHTKAPGTLRSF